MNKKCELCSKDLINVHHTVKYCDECRQIARNNSKVKYDKKKSIENYSYMENLLRENFTNVVSENFHLTPVGFNEISEINYFSYQNFFRTSWFEILKIYNKWDELFKYVVDEFKIFVLTGSQDLKKFTKEHKYINDSCVNSIGKEKLRGIANIKVNRYTPEDYRNNFLKISEDLGRIPLYHEFLKLSSIAPNTYAKHLKIKGKVYDNIVKNYVSENEYNLYLEMKMSHKVMVGRENHQGNKYSNIDIENEFRRVFDSCIENYGTTPTRRLFNKFSNIDDSVYRHRFNKSFLDIASLYGYKIDKTNNKSEKTALETVKKIINEKYIPQMTFAWLRGVNDFPLFCDGFFPDHKLVVEFDGRQHRYPLENFGGMKTFHIVKANDKFKDVLIPRNGLILVRISSEEPFWNEKYIKNKLIENGVYLDNNAAI